jgi:RNA-directed DNA polymerase
MSPEMKSPGQPSLLKIGEGCQEVPMNNGDEAFHQSGGVGAGSGVVKGTGLSREISRREARKPQPSVQAGQTGEPVRARGEVGVARSSVEPEKKEHSGEPRGGTRTHATQSSKGPGDGWSDEDYLFDQIVTPPKVRKLQQALYRKAKAEPKHRFWSLYGDLCRIDVLELAMAAIARNGGAAGVDGQTPAVYTHSEEAWALWRDDLQQALQSKTYAPSSVRRVYIPKADGKMRPLGIPTVKDRVVQAAMVIILQPIFEADFHEHSYAYRPKRNAQQAIAAIQQALRSGRQEVIDADLSGYFDSIPHDKLMHLVARRLSDGSILALIRAWLQATIIEEDRARGTRRTLPNEQGTPQGGVISPLLANIYLDALDKAVNDQCAPVPVMVRYADDFVILCPPGRGAAYLERLKRWLAGRKLKLNESKTRLLNAWQERFKFLGFRIHVAQSPRTRRTYTHVEPHPKSCHKLRDNIRDVLNHWTLHVPEEDAIRSVNRKLKGWSGYFHYGNSSKVFARMQRFVCRRVRRWLWRKHKSKGSPYDRYPDERLYQHYKLWQLPTKVAWKHG